MTFNLITNETLGYGNIAVLNDVSFSFSDGERIAVLGRSGSGKTTLLNAVYQRLNDVRNATALIPQDHALVPQLSVFHNVYMGRLKQYSTICNVINLLIPMPSQKESINKILGSVGLSHLATKKVDQLSGGERQRVNLARALYRGGDILLGDEPVSSVDETQANDLLNRLKENFSTAIIAMHDVDQARNFATRLLGIKDGRIVIDSQSGKIQRNQLELLYEKS